MWEGEWNIDKTVFTGKYTWPHGATFDGEVLYLDKHVIVHEWPGMGEKRVETPAAPHFEFHGTENPPGQPDPPVPER